MASLIKRHAKSCKGHPGAQKSDGPKEPGCTCEPSYFVVVHTGAGGRINVGRNRRTAQQALDKLRGQVATDEYQPLQNITFRAWADQWMNGLRRPKENTKRSYKSTLDYARTAFGDKLVRQITLADIDSFLGLMGDVSASTQGKHLRVLAACLNVARSRGYAARNPLDSLSASERPHSTKRESAYFENAELPRLFAEVRLWDKPLFLAALKTGMRQGELLALEWGDVNLTTRTIRVRRAYVAGIGTVKPKTSAGERDVDIHNGALDVFGELLQELGGSPPDNALVFPGGQGIRHGSNLTRQLYKAMDRAGIPREGPTGEKRTFHSFRHTYAKVAIESGAQITWLQRQLGHSSLNVTANTYGHFETAARKLEASKMEDAFAV